MHGVLHHAELARQQEEESIVRLVPRAEALVGLRAGPRPVEGQVGLYPREAATEAPDLVRLAADLGDEHVLPVAARVDVGP